jgi:Fe-S cluster assembly ATPase SufC
MGPNSAGKTPLASIIAGNETIGINGEITFRR